MAIGLRDASSGMLAKIRTRSSTGNSSNGHWPLINQVFHLRINCNGLTMAVKHRLIGYGHLQGLKCIAGRVGSLEEGSCDALGVISRICIFWEDE